TASDGSSRGAPTSNGTTPTATSDEPCPAATSNGTTPTATSDEPCPAATSDGSTAAAGRAEEAAVRLEDSRPGRLRIGVVGAGRVGAVLGSSLGRAGHEIIGASAVSQASHDRIEALLPGVAIREIDEIVAGADLVL